jgi:WD40 repeat protein
MVGNDGRVLRCHENDVLVLDTGIQQNLRGISVNASNGTALIVGNEGICLSLAEQGNFTRIDTSTSQNLRAVSWNEEGSKALIAGNRGALLKYFDQNVKSIDCGRANLRRVSWRSNGQQALIASNCFAEGFMPSPNLFSYDAGTDHVSSLSEGSMDLIGVGWQPNGQTALVVGYDLVWQKGFIGVLNDDTISPVQFDNKQVFPVAVEWNPSGQLAAIATATTQPGLGKGVIYLWDRKSLKMIHSNDQFYFSSVAWNREGNRLAALASDATRTFNC